MTAALRILLFWTMIAAGIVFVVAIAWPIVASRIDTLKRGNRPKYKKAGTLLTDIERDMLVALKEMVGSDMHVFPSVRLFDLLDLAGGNETGDADLAARVRSEAVDFVLCNAETSAPLLVIELYGKDEDNAAETERHEFISTMLEKAGLPLLPISRHSPRNRLEVAESVKESLNSYIRRASQAA